MKTFSTMLKTELKLSLRGMDMFIFAICAGGVMGLPLVISNYRGKNILKRYKVTPVSPAMILIVQVTIYFLYAISSLFLLYFVAKLFFGYQFRGDIGTFLGAYILVMVSMFSIGIMVGGIAPNTKMAGIIASILYFPMLIFSGATLPYEVMPNALQKTVDILPLTQGNKLLKASSLGLGIDSNVIVAPAIIMTGIAVISVAIAIRFFKWE